ncbi:MAG: hypothetical protein A4E32_00628 [Methanomassiliicoccales archaeon PtaU1.Bin124]|nr:MAG: hypothetical protein A4E32_00628 [Methanomassiliicoccales archaeon PtaU1.Bin124]
MVEFLPFRGLVPVLKNEAAIGRVSPPYDVISPAELERWQSYPYNVTKITLGGKNGSYDDAGKMLGRWIADGALAVEQKDCYYLYSQSFDEEGERLTRIGLVGILAATGYSPDGVIPHEETFSKVKEDRLNLLRGTETHCESIFGIVDDLDDLLPDLRSCEAVIEYEDASGVEHKLVRIKETKAVEKIRKRLADKRMLIADGHHRYETSCRYAQENIGDRKKGFVLATIVASNDPGMIVRPTHRLLAGLKRSEDELVQALSKDFAVAKKMDLEEMLEAMAESSGKDLGFVTRSGRYLILRPKDPVSDALKGLDTYVCEESIIKPLVLEDEGSKVAYDHDLSSVMSRLKAGEFDHAVILSPPSLDVIWEVALDGKKMPKKSTYFWPKMWSGMVYYRMK